jgi:hypothetical protein
VAFTISVVALLVSVGSYLRGERHRLQALKEADLRSFEDYYRALVDYLRHVNNHRAVLAGVAQSTPSDGYPDFRSVPELRQANDHWPLLPGQQTNLSIKALAACQTAWAEVAVLEETIRRRAPPDVFQGAHDKSQSAIEAGNLALNALAVSLIADRAKLRNPRWWPRLSKLLFWCKKAIPKRVLKVK